MTPSPDADQVCQMVHKHARDSRVGMRLSELEYLGGAADQLWCGSSGSASR